MKVRWHSDSQCYIGNVGDYYFEGKSKVIAYDNFKKVVDEFLS